MSGYRTSYVTPAIGITDAPISKKSPEQWRALVEYKGLAFVHDNNYASIAYDLKSARAVFDPNLSGGNGGFRCPVGTRRGGKITDRYGRNCGWGVARRLVNAIGDTARRTETALDKRRERRVERRNARVARQIGVRGYTLPGRRGAATRLDDFADRRDRRQRRGRGGNGPGMATRLEDFADRRDRRRGRGGRGIATRLDDFADRRDRRQDRGGRGVATRLEDFADRDDERRGIKPRRRRAAAPGLENGGQGVIRPDAQNRRSRRTDAVGETATNRPRPAKPQTSAAIVNAPRRRQQGPRVRDDLNSAERNRLDDALVKERDALNARWKTRLGGEEPTPENIRAYVEAREQRSKPAYVNTLKAMERDHAILNSDDRLDRVNELAPSIRKRIVGGSIVDQGAARPQPPRAPRRPVKKRAVKKKAVAKRPAKKAPAKKAPAKKAPAKRSAAKKPTDPNRFPNPGPTDPSAPEEVNLSDLSPSDRLAAVDELDQLYGDEANQKRNDLAFINGLTTDELQDVVSNLDVTVRRLKNQQKNRQLPLDVRWKSGTEAKILEQRKNRIEAALEKNRATSDSPSAPSAPGAAGNPPETPKRQAQARNPFAKLAKRITRKNEAKLGRLDKNGYGKPQRVEVGNKGITNQQIATAHLRDGGDLADVPDDFLGKAIENNSGNLGAARFQIEGDGGGVNGMQRYVDTKTGKKIGLKFMTDYESGRGGYGINEDINEMVGAHIAERLGFANGVMRFAGPIRHSGANAVTPIAVELVDNYIGPKQTITGRENWTVADLVRGQLLDAVILNTDRHGGNYFAKRDGNKHHFVPIDHGLGFNGRPGTAFGGQPNADGFRAWFRDPTGGFRHGTKSFHPKLKEKMRADPAAAAEVRDEILAMQRDLKKAHRQQRGKQAVDDILAAVPNRNPVTGNGRSHYDAIKRLEWLMNANPNEVLDLLKGL
jgi:hypothetical protein